MTLKQLGLASALGAIAAVASFLAARAVLTAWYMHEAPRDGLSALGVFAGSLFSAFFGGVIVFGLSLSRSRKRP